MWFRVNCLLDSISIDFELAHHEGLMTKLIMMGNVKIQHWKACYRVNGYIE